MPVIDYGMGNTLLAEQENKGTPSKAEVCKDEETPDAFYC
jgi:hypothetical protein